MMNGSTPSARRYIELYEKVIGKKFVPEALGEQDIYDRVVKALDKLK